MPFVMFPVRVVEKPLRAFFKQTGATEPILQILKESAAQPHRPLFRGPIQLITHSRAGAGKGLLPLQRLAAPAVHNWGKSTTRRGVGPLVHSHGHRDAPGR